MAVTWTVPSLEPHHLRGQNINITRSPCRNWAVVSAYHTADITDIFRLTRLLPHQFVVMVTPSHFQTAFWKLSETGSRKRMLCFSRPVDVCMCVLASSTVLQACCIKMTRPRDPPPTTQQVWFIQREGEMVWIVVSLSVFLGHSQRSFDRVAQQGLEPVALEEPVSKLSSFFFSYRAQGVRSAFYWLNPHTTKWGPFQNWTL